VTGLGLHCQPGELLQRVQHLAVLADQGAERLVVLIGDYRDRRTAMVHIDVDVTVEIGNVQQLFEVVSGNLALLLEPGTFIGGVHSLRCLLLRAHCCRLVRHGVSLSSYSRSRPAVRWTGSAGGVWSCGPWLSPSLPLCPCVSIAARSVSVGCVGPLRAWRSHSPKSPSPAPPPRPRLRARSPCSSSSSP